MKNKLTAITIATLCLLVTACSNTEEAPQEVETQDVVEEVVEKEKDYLNAQEEEVISFVKTIDDVVKAEFDEDGCLVVTYDNGETGYISGEAYNETVEVLKERGFLDEE